MSTQLLDATAGNKGGDVEIEADEGRVAEVGNEDHGAEGETDDEHEPEEQPAGGKKKLPEDVQRAVDQRIGKEVAKTKSAEERAKAAEESLAEVQGRVDAEDAELVLGAAQEAGVMPQVLNAAEAKVLKELGTARSNAAFFARLLRQAEDGQTEFEVGGQTLTRRQVADQADEWDAQKSRLERRHGHVEGKARDAALEIWKLGLKAKKEGWKPGQRPAAAVTSEQPKPDKTGRVEPAERVAPRPEDGRRGADENPYANVGGSKAKLLDAVQAEMKQEQKRRG